MPALLGDHPPCGTESQLSGTGKQIVLFRIIFRHRLLTNNVSCHTFDSDELGGRPTPLFRLLRFLSTWCCLRLFCTARSKEMKEFFSSFSSSSSSRNASSWIRVSEKSRMRTSSSRYSSFSWETLNVLSSEKQRKKDYIKLPIPWWFVDCEKLVWSTYFLHTRETSRLPCPFAHSHPEETPLNHGTIRVKVFPKKKTHF